MNEIPEWADTKRVEDAVSKLRSPVEEMRARLEGIADGTIRPTPAPWDQFQEVKAAMPGSVNIVCGDPGSSKSLMVLQWLYHAHACGCRVALFELEGQRQWHMMRLLSQLSGVTGVTSLDWVADHMDEAHRHLADHLHALNSFGECMTTAPSSNVTTDELLQWVAKQLATGVKLVAIDPITAIQQQDKPWIEDQRFVTMLRRLVDKHHAAAILVTHPTKGRKADITMDVIAGGTAVVRFSDVVLWLERSKANSRHIVTNHQKHETKGYDCTEVIQTGERLTTGRVLHVLKCRDGTRAGDRLSMRLVPYGLKLWANGWIHDIETHDEPTTSEEAPPW